MAFWFLCHILVITTKICLCVYLSPTDQNPHIAVSNRQTGIWAACNGVTGVCIDVDKYSCTGTTLTGKCPGPTNVRCCPYPNGIRSSPCSGVCTRTASCPGTPQAGKCPGPSYIQCCPSSTSTSDEWAACNGVQGVCIDTSKYSCTSSTLVGKCPGPASIRCCPYPYGVRSSSCDGACTRTSNCPQTTLSNRCPGPSYVRCCPKIPLSTCSTDQSSSTSCELYNNIKGRGNKICTDKWRSFSIQGTGASANNYLNNAFCACEGTPKTDEKAKSVRKCLQDRLLSASRNGKEIWTRPDVRFFFLFVVSFQWNREWKQQVLTVGALV